MVLIVSDGSALVSDVEKHLDLHGDRYIVYYTDFRAAGRVGHGNVIVGMPTAKSVAEAIRTNYITVIIDAVAEPMSRLSDAAQEACTALKIDYVKYIKTEKPDGTRLYLYYSHIAEMVMKCRGSVLFYAKPCTVSAISQLVGEEYADKMYVPVPKEVVFNTAAALEYKIPLLNVIETECSWGSETVSDMINKTGAGLIVCDEADGIEDKISAAETAGIPVIFTHSMGREYKCVAATARDAVIAVHNLRKGR